MINEPRRNRPGYNNAHVFSPRSSRQADYVNPRRERVRQAVSPEEMVISFHTDDGDVFIVNDNAFNSGYDTIRPHRDPETHQMMIYPSKEQALEVASQQFQLNQERMANHDELHRTEGDLAPPSGPGEPL